MLATILAGVLVVYVTLGGLFGVAFVAAFVTKVDPGTRGSGAAFRLMILPGAIALWPLLLRRVLARIAA